MTEKNREDRWKGHKPTLYSRVFCLACQIMLAVEELEEKEKKDKI